MFCFRVNGTTNARAVGDRGLISQLLGPKFGAFLVWGSLGGISIPGLPPLLSIKQIYKLEHINASTKVFAFRHTGYNGIYVPMLVDDVKEFFRVYSCTDFSGFSVGIPHKEAAVGCCDEVDPLAKSIGAVRTIIRRPTGGKVIGYNTDCEACITAIEDALRGRQVANGEASHTSPIVGKNVFVGWSWRGRKSTGIAEEQEFSFSTAILAVFSQALPYEMILANASSVGMQPNSDRTPVSKEALGAYQLVFYAVYTPRDTLLLREAAEVGAIAVSRVEITGRLHALSCFVNNVDSSKLG
ncbi:dehydroquinate dehydratase, putative [Actinidia rufa]|uniref:Dehydroquinate dehydratase, putative n=1 Tax=Actinidia rufa TaxID=165716 RepID=A0A7J0G1J4_9ERIC|nr:dehydroquinate dehydratase, putative [Actinidia rufa]